MSPIFKVATGPILLGALTILFGSCSRAQVSVADPASESVATAPAQSEYQEWISSYTKGRSSGWFDGKDTSVKLVLTAIEGDEETNAKQPVITFDRKVSYGCQVSTTGLVSRFYHSSWGRKGGGSPQIPAPKLKRLEQLLAQLPDDGARLPPAGRRLVVQVAHGEHLLARVYDRANLPDQVLEIIRLSNSGIRSFVRVFSPDGQWKVGGYSGEGVLFRSPDGRFIVSIAMNEKLKFWNPDTHALVKEVASPHNLPSSEICLSPDGSLAAIEGWGEVTLVETKTWKPLHHFVGPRISGKERLISFPQFTPDGRFLLLQSTKADGQSFSFQSTSPELLIYDIRNQKRLTTLPGLPPGVATYVPAMGTARAVTLSPSGTLALWDSKEQREIARLDENTRIARIARVAFSPDKSQVAVVTAHRQNGYWAIYRIRLWNTGTGQLLHELKPFEQSVCEGVDGLLWSPDGRYVFAATKSDGFFTSRGIDIWNTATGRHRGELVGCSTQITGLALLGNQKLVAGCNDGQIRVWDVGGALKDIGAFEKSLSLAQ